jgi:hypothetical protein
MGTTAAPASSTELHRAERWSCRGLVVVATLVGLVGLYALVGPEVDRGYACEPLILGGGPEDDAAAARLNDWGEPACEPGDRGITVAVSVVIVGASLGLLQVIDLGARRRGRPRSE